MINSTMINASDSTSWSLCLRRAYYDYHLPKGFAPEVDRFEELVKEMGLEHEREVLAGKGQYEVAQSAEHTEALMAGKSPVIYQGTLVDQNLGVVCMPDFLTLEDGQYRAEDAKLAGTMKGKKAQIAQIGAYDIVLGSDRRGRALMPDAETYDMTDKDLNTAATFLSEMRTVANADERPAANYTATKCEACPYRAICVPEFKNAENLGLDYFVDNRALPKLKELGITTLSGLAAASSGAISEVPYLKKAEKRQLAILQAQSLIEKRIIRLAPTPSAGGTPIHLDVETWPFGGDGAGTVYLWGILPKPYRAEDYEYVWADEADGGDRKGWMAFLDKVEDLRDKYTGATLVHYTNFELVQIKRYAERFAMQENPTVKWLLDDDSSCFDIKGAVSESLILPVTGYGLKNICKHKDLFNFQWDIEDSGSQWSVVRYHDYLTTTRMEDKAVIRDELLSYNMDDVRATRELEAWLATVQE